MYIRDIMTDKVLTLLPDQTIQYAANFLDIHGVDGAPVIDISHKVIGFFSKHHILRAITANISIETSIEEIMAKDIVTVKAETPLFEFQQTMGTYRSETYPVVNNDNRLVGIFSNKDLLKIYAEQNAFLADELAAILDSMYNGVIAINAEGNVTIFNKAAERITGIPATEVLGKPVQDTVPNSGLTRVLSTGIPELGQRQQIAACQILTNRTPVIRDGNILGALAVFQDTTELETTLAELEDVKNLKSLLESCLESIYEGIIVVDKHGYITKLNKTYADFLGTEEHLAVGKHCTEVVENTRMHIVAQTGKAEFGDVQQIGSNNVVVMRIPIVKDGEIVGVVGKVMFKDIKDLKSLARKVNALRNEVDYYKEELMKALGGKYTFENIIGAGEKMNWLKTLAQKAARSNSTVLILGESGTGKELFAHAIHNASPRRNGPFIKVNCAAIPENLLESELFGYDDGAFTGAKKGGKPGKFELANGGTIFLDEIGDMNLNMQAKLLRVLQEREVERVGGTKTQKIDVRVVAATNRDLEAMIASGEFRQDLYYRLNIISLQIPPLRERTEDISVLCDALLHKLNNQLTGFVEGISAEAMEIIKCYEWPGNVRELENVLERALNMIDDEVQIVPDHLPVVLKKMMKSPEPTVVGKDLDSVIASAEKEAIFKALEAANGNKSKAAQILGIHRSGFYQKLSKYGIS